MRKTEDQPYVENYPPLWDWLNKHEARCQHQLPIGPARDPHAYVEIYLIKGVQVVVVVHADKHGWDIFTSGNDSNIEVTLADADARIKQQKRY